MNFVTFGLILICCHVWVIETNGYPANKNEDSTEFEAFLERFKDVMKNGNETLGIPQLDPFTKNQLLVQINDVINLDTVLKNIVVNGLSEYEIYGGDFTLYPTQDISLNIALSFEMTTNYEQLTGKIGSYEFYGDNGDINMSVKNIKFTAAILYTLEERNNDWYMKVTNVETTFSLEELEVHARGLFNNEEYSNIMSFIISELMPRFIRDNQEIITQNLNDILMKRINNFATDRTFHEILNIIGISI